MATHCSQSGYVEHVMFGSTRMGITHTGEPHSSRATHRYGLLKNHASEPNLKKPKTFFYFSQNSRAPIPAD